MAGNGRRLDRGGLNHMQDFGLVSPRDDDADPKRGRRRRRGGTGMANGSGSPAGRSATNGRRRLLRPLGQGVGLGWRQASYDSLFNDDPNDPNYDPYDLKNLAASHGVVHVVQVEAPDSFKKAVATIWTEYWSHELVDEAIRDFRELGHLGEWGWEVIKRGIVASLDRGNRERELTSQLLPHIHAIVPADAFALAFDRVIERVEDLRCDVRGVDGLIQRFLARAVCDDCVTRRFVEERAQGLRSSEQAPCEVSMGVIAMLDEQNGRLEHIEQCWSVVEGAGPAIHHARGEARRAAQSAHGQHGSTTMTIGLPGNILETRQTAYGQRTAIRLLLASFFGTCGGWEGTQEDRNVLSSALQQVVQSPWWPYVMKVLFELSGGAGGGWGDDEAATRGGECGRGRRGDLGGAQRSHGAGAHQSGVAPDGRAFGSDCSGRWRGVPGVVASVAGRLGAGGHCRRVIGAGAGGGEGGG